MEKNIDPNVKQNFYFRIIKTVLSKNIHDSITNCMCLRAFDFQLQ